MAIKFENIDYYFWAILFFGALLRLISLFIIPIGPDYVSFVAGTKGIIEFDYFRYDTFRPPGFSLIIVPFLFLTMNNYILASKLASFFMSIILIYYSYYVFTEASKQLYVQTNEKREYKAKLIGLLVCILISVNLYFVVNTGRGLREDLLTLLFILGFYYSIIKKEMNMKDNILLALVMTLLTLTLLSAGLFFSAGLLLYYLLSKIKKLKIKPLSNKKIIIVLFVVGISFTFWACFSAIAAGNPLYNWSRQGSFFKDKHNLDMSSLDGLIDALINAVLLGIPFEIYFLFLLISLVFTLLVFYIIIKNFKQKQVLLIFLVVGINFLYISIFMAPSKVLLIPNHPRVMIYLFPFIFYLGTIPLVNIFVKYQTKYEKDSNDKKSINMIRLFFLFLISYSLQGFLYWFDYHGFPPPLHFAILPIYLTDEIVLIIYLLKSKHINYSKIRRLDEL
ncbi:MAG: membrane protein of unknown function [Promethearchaeota archaeon]|nr:MAG: membrane protein of unknown function [Candidatus Lokiarchaeota archaeon]